MPYGPGTYGSKVGRPKKKNKKLSPKQQKIAGMAGNKMKIDGADFAALRRRRGMGKWKSIALIKKPLVVILFRSPSRLAPATKVHKRNKRSTTKVKALTTPTKEILSFVGQVPNFL